MALNMHSKAASVARDIAAVAAGAFLFGASMNMFLLPAQIVLGGFTGIATLINIYTSFPVGVSIIILNVIPAIVNVKFYGIRFLFKTICGILATSLATDLLSFLPSTTTDPIICSLLGGLSMGVGCGLMFTRGFTTGGTDLVAWLLKVKFRSVSLGKLIFAADATVIIAAAIITRSFDTLLYSAVTIFAFSKAVDLTSAGISAAKLAYIFTVKHEEIGARILEELGRGATLLTGEGVYTKEQRHILMCAVDRRELFKLKRIVSECDEGAFVIVSEAAEIIGDFETDHTKLK